MDDILSAISVTPLPTILVIAGILFLFLAIVGKFGANIAVDPKKQRFAGMLGSVLLVGGVALYFLRPSTPSPTPTPIITQTPSATPSPVVPAPTISPVVPTPTPGPTSTLVDIENQTRENWLFGNYNDALDGFAIIEEKAEEPEVRKLAKKRLEWLSPYRGRIIFADDFESDTINNGAKWTLFKPGPGGGTGMIARINEEGNYILEGHGHYHAGARIEEDMMPRDFEIHLRFSSEIPKGGAAFINIMMDEKEGRSSIGLYGENFISIMEEKHGKTTNIDREYPWESKWYMLSVVVIKQHVQVLLDGIVVLDYQSPRSRLFLKGFNLEPLGGSVRFDDVLMISRN